MLLMLWVRFVFVLGVLMYASVCDVWRRQVSNWVWIFCYPIGCVMTLLALSVNLLSVSVVLFSLGCSVGLGLVLFCLGFYGGADVKALIFVGLTTPALPFVFNPAPGVLELPLVLVVFCNATLLTMIWPLSIFILNLKDGLKKRSMFEGIALSLPEKVWLLFTARRVKLAEIEGLRYFPIERVVLQEGQPTRTLVHFVKAEADLSKYRDNLEENKALYKRGVLASPTIPSICFFTLALATAPLGNLFFWAITLLGAI